MKEFWQVWLGLWLGLPNRERKVSPLWDMPTKAKSKYANIQKHADTQQTKTHTPSGFLKREMVLGEQEKKKKLEYVHIQPQIVSDTKQGVAEQITAIQQDTKYRQPIQRTVFPMPEPFEQKETVLFSTLRQAPKEQERYSITKMGALQQEKVFENKQNEKKLTPFLHTATTATYRDSMGQVQQQEQPSTIWKQQGEDAVMLQKILRYYENQQNGVAGNQNVSIQIGHIKQQADVDDVMEALTKKLWEARSITTKKAKGGVSHG